MVTSFLRCFLLFIIARAFSGVTRCVMADLRWFSSFRFFAASRFSRASWEGGGGGGEGRRSGQHTPWRAAATQTRAGSGANCLPAQ